MKSWTILLSTLCLFSCNQQENKFEKYVDPLIGTDIRIVQGKDKNSTEERGQIMPAVGVPHGMTNWVAQTQATEQKCHPPYYYFQDAIQGFRASHWMNGSCTQDYGSITIMPLSNKLEIDPVKRASTFDHTQETATPSYYSVDLNVSPSSKSIRRKKKLPVTTPYTASTKDTVRKPDSADIS